MQFIKVNFNEIAEKVIKCSLKRERLLAKQQRGLNFQKRKYDDPVKKRQVVQKKYNDKKESIKQHKKNNMWKIEHHIFHIREQNMMKISKYN